MEFNKFRERKIEALQMRRELAERIAEGASRREIRMMRKNIHEYEAQTKEIARLLEDENGRIGNKIGFL